MSYLLTVLSTWLGIWITPPHTYEKTKKRPRVWSFSYFCIGIKKTYQFSESAFCFLFTILYKSKQFEGNKGKFKIFAALRARAKKGKIEISVALHAHAKNGKFKIFAAPCATKANSKCHASCAKKG